jgi:glutamyl-tRNA synthetase
LNGVYIRDMDASELQKRLAPFLAEQLDLDEEYLLQSEKLTELIPLIRERIKLLTDAADKIDWAFAEADDITYPDPSLLIGKKLDAAQSVAALRAGREILATIPDFSSEALEAAFREAATEAQVKIGSFFGPFRVAITGKTVSPPLFESMAVLGRDEVVARVDNALRALQETAPQQ